MTGCAYGDGVTLQEAADDLVRRILDLARRLSTVQGTSTDLPPPDPRVLSLLHDVGLLAAEGKDIRERLFGATGHRSA